MKGVKAKKNTWTQLQKKETQREIASIAVADSREYRTQFFSSTHQSLIFPARRPTTCAARVRLHDPARSGSTHKPSMLECGTRRPHFVRNSISTCGMQPPCTTEQKHIHERALTLALTHTYSHLRTIPTPEPDMSEHEGRSPQQKNERAQSTSQVCSVKTIQDVIPQINSHA